MLYRKIEKVIYQHLTANSDKILIVTGARQVGKSFIIRHVGKKLFANVIELNLLEDAESGRLFENVHTTEEFYLRLSVIAGDRLGDKSDTLVFLDEIQAYPSLITLLKFLRQEGRFTYVASGSLLGVTLRATTSIPLGSILIKQMYPLDFEEFLIANSVGEDVISEMHRRFNCRDGIGDALHRRVLDLFKRYLLTGGMPDAVNEYLNSHNIVKIRQIQRDIHTLYGIDASKYDSEHRLKICAIYDMIPSGMENKKKRLVYKDVEGKTGKRYTDYIEEIDYLVSSGIALETKAVSNPSFPLPESGKKNLLKLYLNDVGLLTGVLYHNNVAPILDTECSVNLGAVYENAVAMELAAHANALYYYDNKTKGEVDFLVDDYKALVSIPIEVKSGKDYTVHSALTRLMDNRDYNLGNACVLSNSGDVRQEGRIIYMPVYYVMFFNGSGADEEVILI